MKLLSSSPRPPVAPTGHRFFIALLALFSSTTAAAETWSPEAARARALASSRIDELGDAASAHARARGGAAVPWTNPFVGFQREQSFGASGGTAEDYIWLGQTLDLSLRRGLHVSAGAHRAEASRRLIEQRRREMVVDFERSFFAAVAMKQRVQTHARWLERLEELARVVRAREAAGDASRYDVLRVQREVARSHHHVDEAKVELHRIRAEVAAWLDDEPADMVLEAELRPGPPAQTAASAAPVALALKEEAKALALERDAAGRWFLPPVTVTAGGKTVSAPGVSEVGYLVTLQVPVPLFERLGHRQDELNAARGVAAAEAALAERAYARRAASLLSTWTGALAALDAHLAHATEQSNALVTTARAAWAGGELSLLSLLEAERVNHDDDLASIALSLNAREAQVAYAALTQETPR